MNYQKKKWRNETYTIQAPFFKLLGQADKITVKLLWNFLNVDFLTLHLPGCELVRTVLIPGHT